MALDLAQNLAIPTDPVLWGFVIATVATGYVFLKARRNSRKDPLSAPAPFSSLAAQRRIENQMSELLVELEKMNRQMNAQLDTRSAKLEELIRQADERLGLLDQRLQDLQYESADAGQPFPSRNLRIPPAALSAGDDPSPPSPLSPPPAPIPIDPRHAIVYRLADQGRSAHDIAREVNQPANEVELILALRRK